jgi:Flp pilus assembly protein TadG
VRKFARDERGQFAIIGALLMVPVIAISGLALDYTRLHSAQSRLQSAADAAALAAVGAAGEPVARLQQLAADFVAANADGLDVDTETRVEGKHLEVQVTSEIATPLLSVIGSQSVMLTVTAGIDSPVQLAGGSVIGGNDAPADYERLRRRIAEAMRQLPRAQRERLARKYADILSRRPARLAR